MQDGLGKRLEILRTDHGSIWSAGRHHLLEAGRTAKSRRPLEERTRSGPEKYSDAMLWFRYAVEVSFYAALLDEVCGGLQADYTDNFDHYRFSAEPPPCKANAALLSPFLAAFERLYSELNDKESRSLLVKLLAFRALGHRRIRLPLSTPQYWESLKRIEALRVPEDYIQIEFHKWKLHRFALHSAGVPVDVYSTTMTAYTQFLLPQYAHKSVSASICVRPGDMVIDAGACWGDSALYFANCAGPAGRVYAFEPVPENLSTLRRNLVLNPDLATRIHIVEAALLDSTSAPFTYLANGPATRASGSGSETAQVTTIDEFVESEGLERVDFVKMDIESSEPQALTGGLSTLRRFRPVLAIAIYHSLEDFTMIPAWICSLGLGYKIYLGHASIHSEETILFAAPENRA